MTSTGLAPVVGDDSFGFVPVDALIAAGSEFVIVYLCEETDKCVTSAYFRACINAGLKVVFFYEDGATDFQGGAAVGIAKAEIAQAVLDTLTMPDGTSIPLDRPVHPAMDFSMTAELWPSCLAAVQAFAAQLGRPAGIYGDDNCCTWANEAGIRYQIQFGENLDGGLGPIASATIYQGYDPELYIGGVNVDPDTALAPDYGQVPYMTITPVPVPILANGQGQSQTSVPWANRIAVTANFGVGDEPKGAVGWLNVNGAIQVTAFGFNPGETVNVDLTHS